MTVLQLFGILAARPFPGSVDLRMSNGGCCFTVEGVALGYYLHGWGAYGRVIPAEWPIPGDLMSDTARVHAEIRRVLAVLAEPAPSWEEVKERCVGPDLPGDDTPQDRITDEIDRRKDVEAQLAKVTAERDQARQACLDLSANNPLRPTVNAIAERLGTCPAEPGPMLAEVDRLKGLADAHAVVSQRLVGAQKEVAERDATIDELRTALESIAANVGLVGSDQWAVGEIVGKVGEATARAAKVEDRLRRDDDLRSAIAVAVGLDGSASLALILDTVARDRPGREISRLSGLLDVLAAPVTFGERRLSAVERAEWALRRWLAEGEECSARMAQLIDAEVYLDVLGVPAYAAVPSDDPGDASEALTVAERLRLHFGARS